MAENIDKYQEIRGFFSNTEWNKLSEPLQNRNLNLYKNYNLLQSLGFSGKLPDFMRKRLGAKVDQDSCGPSSSKRRKVQTLIAIKRKIQKIRSTKGNIKLDEDILKRMNIKKMRYKEASQDDEGEFHGFSYAEAEDQLPVLVSLSQVIARLEAEIKRLQNEVAEERRYPKRSAARKDYTEDPIPNDDDYLFCDSCDQEWEGDCPIHGPLIIIEDTKVPQDPNNNLRAEQTVPACLCVDVSGIRGAGDGVWTTQHLPFMARFGPYEGTIENSRNKSGYCWEIRDNGKPTHCIDASINGMANWMRFVNCARRPQEQNLFAYQYKGNIYYRTIRPIPPNVELMVWYGDAYGKELGINTKKFHEPQKQRLADGWTRGEKPLESGTGQRRPRGNQDRDTHGEDKKDQSEHDQKSCTKPSNLTRHMRTHTGVTPFQCSICEYKTSRQHDLKKHMMTHTGEKPFQCSVCKQRFIQKGALNRHMMTHTGEKPFQCFLCEQRFAKQWSLENHMKSHPDTNN